MQSRLYDIRGAFACLHIPRILFHSAAKKQMYRILTDGVYSSLSTNNALIYYEHSEEIVKHTRIACTSLNHWRCSVGECGRLSTIIVIKL